MIGVKPNWRGLRRVGRGVGDSMYVYKSFKDFCYKRMKLNGVTGAGFFKMGETATHCGLAADNVLDFCYCGKIPK